MIHVYLPSSSLKLQQLSPLYFSELQQLLSHLHTLYPVILHIIRKSFKQGTYDKHIKRMMASELVFNEISLISLLHKYSFKYYIFYHLENKFQ